MAQIEYEHSFHIFSAPGSVPENFPQATTVGQVDRHIFISILLNNIFNPFFSGIHMELHYSIRVTRTKKSHTIYAEQVCAALVESARVRGTGIAKRSEEYIRKKIESGHAIIALDQDDKMAGFCYIESWGEAKNFVANSGLIVLPEYRQLGLGRKIKKAAFRLSRQKFPEAKLFGITTSPAVMKINAQLGYHAVALSQLTDDDSFWAGCQSCTNYDILQRTKRRHCLCTAMLFDPERITQIKEETETLAS